MGIHIGFTKTTNKLSGSTKSANPGLLEILKTLAKTQLEFQVLICLKVISNFFAIYLFVMFIGPKGDDSMPTTISCGWRYAEELENDKPGFVDAKEGDIAFKDFSKAHI